jgi:hypothetical protein
LQNFINYFHTCPSTAALSSTMSQDQHKVSPHYAGLRKRAARKLELCAKSMKVLAMKKGVGKAFEVGEVVLVPLHKVLIRQRLIPRILLGLLSKLILIECWRGLL